MDLIKLLQKLKAIKADPDYARMSRDQLLGLSNERTGLFRATWQFILHSLQFGSALALATILIMLIVGGFAAWKSVSHVKLGSLNLSSLQVEAEAIDVQIQLTNIVYSEPEGLETTQQTAITPKILKAKEQAKSMSLKPVSSSSAPTITIDEALDRLSE